VPRALDAGDPGVAERAFAAIEDTGRDALVEMRRLLGVLRRDDDRAELAPQPGLARLEALVERARESGLDVTVRAALGASTGLVVVRPAAGGRPGGGRHDRAGGPPSRLPGLRDRAKLYGGFLDAEPYGDWFALRARLPIEHEAAPALSGQGS
jgi:signal transduction histidine kinase